MNITRNIAIHIRRYARVGLFLTLISCGSMKLCSDAQHQTALSPDHVLRATFLVRDCGATADFSSIVNVQVSTAKFKADEGRVFVAKGEHKILLEWTGQRALLVQCSTCSRKDIFQENVALGDVDISYSLAPQK